MSTTTNMPRAIHQGRNIKRFREMRGLKQEGLALELGDDWTQKRISLLEQKEEVEPQLLEQVAKVLKVPVEAIQNFDDQAAVNIIAETVNNHDQSSMMNYFPVFNAVEKWVTALEENKHLYERLLQAEREKNELLQKLLDKH